MHLGARRVQLSRRLQITIAINSDRPAIRNERWRSNLVCMMHLPTVGAGAMPTNRSISAAILLLAKLSKELTRRVERVSDPPPIAEIYIAPRSAPENSSDAEFFPIDPQPRSTHE
jgi:hypothetical protein